MRLLEVDYDRSSRCVLHPIIIAAQIIAEPLLVESKQFARLVLSIAAPLLLPLSRLEQLSETTATRKFTHRDDSKLTHSLDLREVVAIMHPEGIANNNRADRRQMRTKHGLRLDDLVANRIKHTPLPTALTP